MLKLTEKSRKILKSIFRGVGAVTFSLAVSTCWWPTYDPPAMYGPGPDFPYEDEAFILGKIVSKKTGLPVQGVGIWVKDVTSSYAYIAGSTGEFHIWLPKQDSHTIVFTDIDGEENGLFKQLTLNWTWEYIKGIENPYTIEMEEVEPEIEEEPDEE